MQGKLRIQQISLPNNNDGHRISAYPVVLYPITHSMTQTSHQLLQFDYNKNPIILKCRLYVIKALLYRGWDSSGKADPYLKIVLNNDTIIDGVKDKLQNTLEPVFGK